MSDAVISLPLAVDLDGTLSRANSIAEQLASVVRRRPWSVLSLLAALLRGRPAFKRRLQELSPIEHIDLPYHPSLVAYCEAQHAAGREIILVTAADQSTATHVASLFPFIREGVGSGPDNNLSGRAKGAYLAQRYGEKGFVYAGNEARDLRVWERAGGAIVVNPSMGLARAAAKLTTVEKAFEDRPSRLRTVVRQLRPHQWLKNILIFVPLFTAHRLGDQGALVHTIVAFAAFCAAASGAYVLNDLIDLPSDRAHPTKRARPFASGDLAIGIGAALFPALLLAAALLSWWLPVPARLLLASYVIVTLLYTFFLKKIALLDVLVLAGLYALRIVMGHLATDIAWSPWLTAFALCMFLSLALLKRFCELFEREDGHAPGRGYHVGHRSIVGAVGIAAGCIAAGIMAFYAGSAHVQTLYAEPRYLYALCPVFLAWILRMWNLGYRGKMHEDPVLFTLHDLVSVGALALTTLIVLVAK